MQKKDEAKNKQNRHIRQRVYTASIAQNCPPPSSAARCSHQSFTFLAPLRPSMSEQARSAAAHGRRGRPLFQTLAAVFGERFFSPKTALSGKLLHERVQLINHETIPPRPFTTDDNDGCRCLCQARGPIYLNQCGTNLPSFTCSLQIRHKKISQVAKTLKAFLLIRKEATMLQLRVTISRCWYSFELFFRVKSSSTLFFIRSKERLR